ncbi:uncharacterized protein LOC144566194 [Carex rostrata]
METNPTDESRFLHLTSCQLHDLADINLPEILEEIDLTANRLTKLDECISLLSHLKKLSLRQNLLTIKLSSPSHSGMQSLEMVLRDNKLTNIPDMCIAMVTAACILYFRFVPHPLLFSTSASPNLSLSLSPSLPLILCLSRSLCLRLSLSFFASPNLSLSLSPSLPLILCLSRSLCLRLSLSFFASPNLSLSLSPSLPLILRQSPPPYISECATSASSSAAGDFNIGGDSFGKAPTGGDDRGDALSSLLLRSRNWLMPCGDCYHNIGGDSFGTQENVICNYYLQSWRNQILSQDTRWISMEKVALDLQLYA